MNLSNISAFAISITLEHIPEKINEIQSLRFAIESFQPTAEGGVMIRAKLIREGHPKQTIDEIHSLIYAFMHNMNQARDAKRNPYVW